MERKLIANHLVPDDEVWVSPATWERPFSLKAKESTATNLQQLKAEIRLLLTEIEYDERGIGQITKGAIARKLRELSAV
jgi:hypothetical protein